MVYGNGETVKFVGIDDWNRPIFKGQKNYYGSTDKIFDYSTKEEELKKELTENDLLYFGTHFGCEPDGNPCNVKIEWR